MTELSKRLKTIIHRKVTMVYCDKDANGTLSQLPWDSVAKLEKLFHIPGRTGQELIVTPSLRFLNSFWNFPLTFLDCS
jgi:hypothetical protein